MKEYEWLQPRMDWIFCNQKNLEKENNLAWFFKQIWKFHLLKQERTFSRGQVARTPFFYVQPLSPPSSGSGDAGTPSLLSLIWDG